MCFVFKTTKPSLSFQDSCSALGDQGGDVVSCALVAPVLQPVLLGEGGAGCLLLLMDSQLFVIFSQNKYSEAIISHWSQPQKCILLLLFLESFENVCLVEIISVGACMSAVKFLTHIFFSFPCPNNP